MSNNGSRARVTFVVLDAGQVFDVRKKSIPAGAGQLRINGKMIDLDSCRTASL